jgi:hypothetical protein
MAAQRGTPKTLSTFITVIALLLTVASGTYAVSMGGYIKREEALEVRVNGQEITSSITVTKIDNMKDQLNRIEGLLTKHIEGGSK